ncbi:MAG: sensor histidine kinase [Oscillospiraceae bacterium]
MSKATEKNNRNKRGRIAYRNSMFGRMLIYYLIISVSTIALFCIVWYQSTSQWLTNQNLSYNRQQLEALYKTVESQYTTLKQTQFRLYTYKVDDSAPIYTLVDDYLRLPAGAVSSQEMAAHQEDKMVLDNYVSTIERPQDRDMRLFLFAGPDDTGRSIYYTQTKNRLQSSTLVKIVEERMRSTTSGASLSRRSIYTIPTFSAQSGGNSMDIYILFDYIRDIENPAQHLGYVANVYNPETLENVLRGFLDPLVGKAYIVDRAGGILYDSTGEGYGQSYANFERIDNRRGDTYTDGNLRTTVLYSPSFNFYVVGELEQNSAFYFDRQSYIRIFQVAVIALIAASLLSLLVVRGSSRRVSVLLDSIYKARSDIKTRAPLTVREDELDVISRELNDMLGRIEEHILLSYEREIEQQAALISQRDAELYALQSQVNPHFLYNTLEIIRMKAMAAGDEDVVMMIKSLANLFRERTRGLGVVLLKQELNVCQELLVIYGLRYDSSIELELRIQPQLYSTAVLRDILTPLVENALVHGLSEGMNPEDLNIRVEARQEGDDLLMLIHNDGAVIPEMQLRQLREDLQSPVFYNASHVGLRNIHSRLRLIYGEGYGIQVSSPPEGGVDIQLRMRICTPEELAGLANSNL